MVRQGSTTHTVTTSSAVRYTYTSTIDDLDHTVHLVLIWRAAVKEMTEGLLDVSPQSAIPISIDTT
jgi:hypothetical protein